jgi:hypothetical protein
MEKNLTDDLVFASLMLLTEIALAKTPGIKIKKRSDVLLKAVTAVQATWKRNLSTT